MKNEFLQALTHVNYNSNWIQCQANGLCIIEVHEPNTSVDIVQKSLHFQLIYFNIANTVIFSMEDFFLFLFFFPEDFMLSCKVLLLTSFNFFFFLRSQVADPFQLEVNRMILVSGSLPHLTDIQSDTAEGFWVVWQSPFHVTEDALHLLWGLQTHFLYFFSLSPLIQTVLFLIVINSDI